MSRPTDLPDFATGTNYAAGPYAGHPNKAKPSAGVIAEGFDPQAPMPAEWLNWYLNNHAAWIDCIDAIGTFTPPSTVIDVPQLSIKDSAGNVRSVVGHGGYLMGRRFDVRENWQYSTGTVSTSQTPIATAPMWSSSLLTGTIVPQSPTALYPSPFLQINSGTPAGTVRGVLYSANAIVHTGFTGLALVLEWEAGVTVVSDSIHVCQNFMGLSDVFAPPVVNSGNYILFRYLADGGHVNWLADTCSGGTATSVDTGVLVTTDIAPKQRFRIEVYGSATPYGSMVRFFINESLVATTTTNISSAAMYLTFAASAAAGGTSMQISLGGVQAVYNRSLSVANL